MNARMRFCRYQSGQEFSINQDGVHHRATGWRSMVTFIAMASRGFESGPVVTAAQELDAWEPRFSLRFTAPTTSERSFLQLPLQDLDLVGQHGVVAHQSLDLANRVQHGGVIASAEPAADFGQ